MVDTVPACAWERHMPAVAQSVVRLDIPITHSIVRRCRRRIEWTAITAQGRRLGPGCQVVTATNGLSALRLVNTFRPHVVIMDLQMPIMDGLEAARQMREQAWGRSMVLIAASGQPPEVAQSPAREAGFDEHVLKPLDPSWIGQRVVERLRSTEAIRRTE